MRKKKQIKAKEPIRIRFKAIANGNKSIYLDCYQNGKRSYEFLKLYLIPETSEAAKVQNANTLQAANAIKAQRIMELANNQAGIKSNSQFAKMLLVDWMEVYQKVLLETARLMERQSITRLRCLICIIAGFYLKMWINLSVLDLLII